MKIEEIKKIILSDGGCSLDYNLNSIKEDEGYMVSYQKYEVITKDIDEVLDIIKEYQKKIENKKGAYIGVWLDEGIYYIDISKHFIDKAEALEFGKYNKQLAIYDLKNNDSIYLKNYKFIKFYNIYDKEYKLINQFDSIDEIKDFINYNIKERILIRSIYLNLTIIIIIKF